MSGWEYELLGLLITIVVGLPLGRTLFLVERTIWKQFDPFEKIGPYWLFNLAVWLVLVPLGVWVQQNLNWILGRAMYGLSLGYFVSWTQECRTAWKSRSKTWK